MPLWKDYLTFSKRERSGILVLLSLILLVLTANQLVGVFYQNDLQKDFTGFQKEIDEFEKGISDSVVAAKEIPGDKYSEKNKKFLLTGFDPNSSSLEELISLGLTSKLSKTIISFREKGGKFNQPDDLKKIYGMNDSVFVTIQPFITIQKVKTEKNSSSENKYSKNKILIDLNSADTTQLQLLYGIGSKLSKRIIIFRDALGGFHSVDQLKDVYGLKPEVIEKNSDKLTVSGAVKKININSCSAEELKNHPYIAKWNIANAIVNYRQLHGNYISIADVQKTDLVNADLYSKLAPYLTVE